MSLDPMSLSLDEKIDLVYVIRFLTLSSVLLSNSDIELGQRLLKDSYKKSLSDYMLRNDVRSCSLGYIVGWVLFRKHFDDAVDFCNKLRVLPNTFYALMGKHRMSIPEGCHVALKPAPFQEWMDAITPAILSERDYMTFMRFIRRLSLNLKRGSALLKNHPIRDRENAILRLDKFINKAVRDRHGAILHNVSALNDRRHALDVNTLAYFLAACVCVGITDPEDLYRVIPVHYRDIVQLLAQLDFNEGPKSITSEMVDDLFPKLAEQ